jgi:hypothetical protein
MTEAHGVCVKSVVEGEGKTEGGSFHWLDPFV